MRARAECGLPAVPDVRLCHNVRELLNGAKIQVEVQAVAMSSVSNVLDAVKSHTDQVFASAEGRFEYACGIRCISVGVLEELGKRVRLRGRAAPRALSAQLSSDVGAANLRLYSRCDVESGASEAHKIGRSASEQQ